MKENRIYVLMTLMGIASSYPFSQYMEYALVKSKPKTCSPPYKRIGSQCLYFSAPYEPWGVDNHWDQAYKSFYGAAVFCLSNGGFLAERILDVDVALQFCNYSRGSCTPSLLARNGRCYQWSPLDGSESELPCNTENLKTRFICEEKS